MTKLTTFLLDRIAEDEAAVQPPGRGSAVPSRGAHAPAPGRWSAERIRAECQAKRRIVELHRSDIGADPCDAHDASLASVVCDTLLALAQVYADHPEYDPSWAA